MTGRKQHAFTIILCLSQLAVGGCSKKEKRQGVSVDDHAQIATDDKKVDDLAPTTGYEQNTYRPPEITYPHFESLQITKRSYACATDNEIDIIDGTLAGFRAKFPANSVAGDFDVYVEIIAVADGGRIRHILRLFGNQDIKTPIQVTLPSIMVGEKNPDVIGSATATISGTPIEQSNKIVDITGKLVVTLTAWGEIELLFHPVISISGKVNIDAISGSGKIADPFSLSVIEDQPSQLGLSMVPLDQTYQIVCEASQNWIQFDAANSRLTLAADDGDITNSVVFGCKLLKAGLSYHSVTFAVKVIPVNDPPSFSFTIENAALSNLRVADLLPVSWQLNDPDGNAEVSFYYGNNMSLACDTHTELQTAIKEDSGTTNFNWNLANLLPGTYHLCAKVSDEGGTSSDTWLASPVVISNFCTGSRLSNPVTGNGSGTTEDPYIICTAEQLNAVGQDTSLFLSHFILGADLELSGYTGTQFNRIGSQAIKFSGSMDGKGHTISNFTFNDPTADYAGLFGSINSTGEIKNITFVNANVVGKNYVGILAGQATSANLRNIVIASGSVSGASYIGGISGRATAIYDSNSAATVSATDVYAGGLSGSIDNYLVRSHSSGHVTSTSNYVGGLTGYVSSGTCNVTKDACGLYKSYAANNVTGIDRVGGLAGGFGSGGVIEVNHSGVISGQNYVGGLVGYQSGQSQLYNSWATSTVSATVNCAGGLVGYATNVKFVDSHATGSVSVGTQYGGGLVGYMTSSTISRSYATGTVTGGDSVGGLVGSATANTNVFHSYATGNVAGGSNVGGLVGWNTPASAKIMYSYARAAVSATGTKVGGLAGLNDGIIVASYAASNGAVTGNAPKGGLIGSNTANGKITDALWDTTTSALASMCGANTGTGCVNGNGLDTAAMQTLASYQSRNWDFAGSLGDGPNDDWFFAVSSYPSLYWQLDPNPDYSTRFAGGNGNADSPFQVATADQLNSLGRNQVLMQKHFIVTTDIDVSGIANFRMIGDEAFPFLGTFDGDNYTISNLTLSKPTTDYVGLFSWVTKQSDFYFGSSAGLLKDIKMIGASIAGRNFVGALVGLNSGDISGCEITGTTNGTNYVGGVGGYVSTVSNCTVSGSVAAADYVGGLAGLATFKVSDSTSSATVSGTSNVGGLIGSNDSGGEIHNSSSSGNVTGTSYTGGLVGYFTGLLKNASATGTIVGQAYTGGALGYTYYGNITDLWASGAVTGTNNIGGLIGYSYYSYHYNVHATGNVTATAGSAGGLFGYLYRAYVVAGCYAEGNVAGTSYAGGIAGYMRLYGDVDSCYATGDVTAQNYIGGIAGYFDGQSSYDEKRIRNVYARGVITGQNGAAGQNLGGLLGSTTAYQGLTNAYFAGSIVPGTGVTGTQRVGAVIGSHTDGCDITGVFWDETGNTGLDDIGYNSVATTAIDHPQVFQETTANMTEDTYVLYKNKIWDFFGRWQGDANVNDGYPTLQLPFEIEP